MIALSLLVDPIVTVAVAWAVVRWLPGFDYPGPFLLMSPTFVGSLVFGTSAWTVVRQSAIGDPPRRADRQLIESVSGLVP